MFETLGADLYDLFYLRRKDYEREAGYISKVIRARRPEARSMLEVACGTGAHLKFLSKDFEIQGLDLSAELLTGAKMKNPGITFHQADMADFDLGQTFDVVSCLFSSIAYLETLDKLHAAVRRMAAHLNDGGLLLVEPWLTPEEAGNGFMGMNAIDEPELKACRMINVTVSPGMTHLLFHYLICGRTGGIEHFVEKHDMGLFDRQQMKESFAQAGLEVDYLFDGPNDRGLYVGWRS